MHYVRFLKVPAIRGDLITALVTVTSDLGDTFLAKDIPLLATLQTVPVDGSGRAVVASKTLQWSAGMRTLALELAPSGREPINSPVQVHVRAKHATVDFDAETQLPRIIAVWSAPLDPAKGVVQSEKVVQRHLLIGENTSIDVWEETGNSIARHLWDAGVALTARLNSITSSEHCWASSPLRRLLVSASSKTRSILELGCGCGVVGIGLSRVLAKSKVIVSDLPEVLDIVQRNIAVNDQSTVSFQALDWESPLPDLVSGLKFDLIVMADCTYNSDSSPALVRTLRALADHSADAIVVVAMKKRHTSEAVFFDLMAEAQFACLHHGQIPLPIEDDQCITEKVDIYEFMTQ